MCFKHENTSSEINVSELKDDKLAEDLVKREGDQSDDLKKDWFAAIHAVFTSFVLFWILKFLFLVNADLLNTLCVAHVLVVLILF